MRAPKTLLRPVLGCLVIAHGLAHAVMPLRGWMDPVRLALDFTPFLLYAIVVAGFALAGLGLLGVRRLEGVVRPALVLASGYSLVSIWVMGTGGLWWGRSLDVVLLLTGLTGVYRYLPQPQFRGLAFETVVVATVIYGAVAVVAWPLHRTWGSNAPEHSLALPGDDLTRDPALELQHAVTINAPPEQVWPWLVQLGQDRAGFYSYDWLERAFGVRIHNVAEIRPEWQQRQAGDRVRATQDDYLAGVLGKDLGWTVTDLEPNRAMVLQHWGAFVLEPRPDGKTRFIIRTRVGNPKYPTWAAPLDMMAFEMPHFIMERRMMLQIKKLAESNASRPS